LPGILLHLIAGTSLFLIGEYYFRYKYQKLIERCDHILLFGTCMVFSLIPDITLGLYYVFHISTFETLVVYHYLFQIILIPAVFIGIFLLKFVIHPKKTLIWMFGMFCILLHIVMDFFIPEYGVWI